MSHPAPDPARTHRENRFVVRCIIAVAIVEACLWIFVIAVKCSNA